MSKIKNKIDTNTIKRSQIRRGSECPQVPAFSFEILTKNKTYNLEYFLDSNDKREATCRILLRLKELCEKSWEHWHGLGKKAGLETIPAERLNFEPSEKQLSSGDKVIVFRLKSYANKDARIIGMRRDGCPIFYIIGFDFDFSAYNHG